MLNLRIELRRLIKIFSLDANGARKMISHCETVFRGPTKSCQKQEHCKAREEWIEVQNFFKKQNHASSSPQAPEQVIDVALACSTKQVSIVKVQTTITEGMEGYRVWKADIIWDLTI